MSDSVSTGATGITAVFVPFRDTPIGHAAMRYAADLGERLHAPLHVQYLAPRNGTDSAEDRRVRARAVELLGERPRTVSYVFENDVHGVLPKGALVVDTTLAQRRTDAWVVASQSEASVCARGQGPVCIPLGDGESGSHASFVGIPIARALGLPVVFYHTTWRNPAVASDEARAHMDPDAQLVLATAQQHAVAQRVSCHAVVEMADGVAEGIVRAALRERCSLILTARGRGTGRGSYVDQLLVESPIPVWSAPRKEAP